MLTYQEHEFCQSTLHGTVVTAHYAHVLELESRVVSAHLHCSCVTLADVHHSDSAACSLLEQSHEPGVVWRVSAAVGPHHYGAKFRRLDYVARDLLLHTREEREHGDVGV